MRDRRRGNIATAAQRAQCAAQQCVVAHVREIVRQLLRASEPRLVKGRALIIDGLQRGLQQRFQCFLACFACGAGKDPLSRGILHQLARQLGEDVVHLSAGNAAAVGGLKRLSHVGDLLHQHRGRRAAEAVQLLLCLRRACLSSLLCAAAEYAGRHCAGTQHGVNKTQGHVAQQLRARYAEIYGKLSHLTKTFLRLLRVRCALLCQSVSGGIEGIFDFLAEALCLFPLRCHGVRLRGFALCRQP